MRPLFISALAILCLTGCGIKDGGCFAKKMGQGRSLCKTSVEALPDVGQGRISVAKWLPNNSPRGVIVASPGFDEAACELWQLGEHLAAKGYAVIACELRGQGKDMRKDRGNFSDWERWIQDFGEVARHAHRRYPNAPLFFAGQSTGTLVAINAATRTELRVRGVILQSPAALFVIRSPLIPPTIRTMQFLTLNQSRFTTPGLLRFSKKSIMANCEDEKAWETSPDRVCEGFTFKSFAGCYSLGKDTGERMTSLRTPILVQYGGHDPLLPKAAKEQVHEFAARIGSNDETVLRYPEGYHDLLNDSMTRPQLLRGVVEWLSTRASIREGIH